MQLGKKKTRTRSEMNPRLQNTDLWDKTPQKPVKPGSGHASEVMDGSETLPGCFTERTRSDSEMGRPSCGLSPGTAGGTHFITRPNWPPDTPPPDAS